MARPVTVLVIFFIAFNLFAGMLMTTGVAADMGIDAETGGDQAVQSAANSSSSISTGSGLGSTLFGMYNALVGVLDAIFNMLFPGLAMLERVGVPGYVTGFLGPLFTIMIGIDVISFLRGWGL